MTDDTGQPALTIPTWTGGEVAVATTASVTAFLFITDRSPNAQFALLAVTASVGLGAILPAARQGLAGAARLLGRIPSTADLGAATRSAAIAWAVLTIGLGGAAMGLEQLLDVEILSTNQNALTELAAGRGAGPAAVAVSVMIMAPICEELMFRGLLLGWAANRWGPIVGTAVSATVFGAIHAQPYTALITGLFGVVLARLTLRYGSILPAIAAHATFNTIGFLLVRLTG